MYKMSSNSAEKLPWYQYTWRAYDQRICLCELTSGVSLLCADEIQPQIIVQPLLGGFFLQRRLVDSCDEWRGRRLLVVRVDGQVVEFARTGEAAAAMLVAFGCTRTHEVVLVFHGLHEAVKLGRAAKRMEPCDTLLQPLMSFGRFALLRAATAAAIQLRLVGALPPDAASVA